MGCMQSKDEGGRKLTTITMTSLIRRIRKRGANKVVPLDAGTPMINISRKTEKLVLEQLWSDRILPKRRDGGVAFVIEMKDDAPKPRPHTLPASCLPGVPQHSYDVKPRPGGLPPLSQKGKLIEFEQTIERARLNREKVLEGRKAKAAKTVEVAMRRQEKKLIEDHV